MAGQLVYWPVLKLIHSKVGVRLIVHVDGVCVLISMVKVNLVFALESPSRQSSQPHRGF